MHIIIHTFDYTQTLPHLDLETSTTRPQENAFWWQPEAEHATTGCRQQQQKGEEVMKKVWEVVMNVLPF